MAGAAVDAAAAVNAVGVAEETVLGVAGRVEAERACLGAEAAFDAFAFPCHAAEQPHSGIVLLFRAD